MASDNLANEELKKYREINEYNNYQEDLAFAKELNILRNDFYYKMIDSKHTEIVDFLYRPLDVMSGDAYSAREIDENRTFYLIVDGMGKGLSASLTAMLMTSFINHLIDKMKMHDSFDLNILIKESMEYIQPILLEEEALAIDYILMNNSFSFMEYAKFAMPVMLLQNENKKIIRIPSNNPPLSKYQNDFKISSYKTSDISKFLFYSDGVVENSAFEDKAYSDYIEEDFASSYTREDLKNKLYKKIETQEDDMTLIFINRLNFTSSLLCEKSFDCTLDDVDNSSEWYSQEWAKITDNSSSYNADIVFTELFMNAFEHGNLGINSSQKHELIEEDIYLDTLIEKSAQCKKKIFVKLYKIVEEESTYIITRITDEGDGFDTQILSTIFRNSQAFNGRGIFVSRKNSFGIYYNHRGNSVLYLNKI
jgi:imidazoleglycerol phosphate dehydratase HisB